MMQINCAHLLDRDTKWERKARTNCVEKIWQDRTTRTKFIITP